VALTRDGAGAAGAGATGARRSAFRWRRLLQVLAGALVLAYVGGYVYLYLAQDRLMFQTRPMTAQQAAEVQHAFADARSIAIHAPDGTLLHAWYRPAAEGHGLRKVLVYFGASTEQAYWQLAPRPAFAGWDLLLVDYRGYGLSGGKPAQAALQDDASLWLDRVEHGGDGIARADRIVVMGTSIGSYLATHVAATRKVDGVVLVVPADSVRSLVQSMLPVYPIRWLLHNPFDSMADAPSVRAPTLFIVAMQDKLVSMQRARRLYDQWGSRERQWLELPQANHYTASADPEYWRRLGAFLGGL
jgi:pimeloyl-ACP methyl ester carboxylesterase